MIVTWATGNNGARVVLLVTAAKRPVPAPSYSKRLPNVIVTGKITEAKQNRTQGISIDGPCSGRVTVAQTGSKK